MREMLPGQTGKLLMGSKVCCEKVQVVQIHIYMGTSQWS